MKLYDSTTSPFCRKVNLVIRALGLQDQIESVIVAGTPVAPGTLPVNDNPLGKIPCLIKGEQVIFDSGVICQALVAEAGQDLYGPDRIANLTLEALADGLLDAAILVVYEARVRPEDFVYEPWVEGQLAKINRALDAFEAQVSEFGEGPETVGRLAVASSLGYLDFRGVGAPWRDGRPALAAWYAAYAEKTDMVETQPH